MTLRVQALDERDAPLVARPIYWMTRRMFGKVLTPVKVQARRPGILWLGGLLGIAIERSGKVEPRLHTLVQFRAAQIIECPF